MSQVRILGVDLEKSVVDVTMDRGLVKVSCLVHFNAGEGVGEGDSPSCMSYSLNN